MTNEQVNAEQVRELLEEVNSTVLPMMKEGKTDEAKAFAKEKLADQLIEVYLRDLVNFDNYIKAQEAAQAGVEAAEEPVEVTEDEGQA